MPQRGTYNFDVDDNNDLIYSRDSVNKLRNLWLDSQIILPEGPGPGRYGDFDNGAWHVACHLVAAGGVKK